MHLHGRKMPQLILLREQQLEHVFVGGDDVLRMTMRDQCDLDAFRNGLRVVLEMTQPHLQGMDFLVHILRMRKGDGDDEVGVVISGIEKLVRHVLVGVELIVQVVTVENEHSLQSLEFKGEAASKPPRFYPNVVRDISRYL